MFNLSLCVRLNISSDRDRKHSMTDWLDDTFKEIDQRDDARWRQRDWLVRCDKRINIYSRGVWKKLQSAIKAYVQRVNEHYSANTARHLSIKEERGGDNTNFSIETECCPQMRVFISFNREAQLVECEYTRRTSRQEEEEDLTNEGVYLGFHVDDQDNVSLALEGNPMTIDEVSQMLLMPLIDRKD
jgi:hypothetical protein